MNYTINGRRGAYQLMKSTVYLLLGASFSLFSPPESRMAALGYLGGELGIRFAGLIWIICGLVGLTGAFNRRDWYSFAMLTFAPAVWGSLFFIGVLFGAPLINLVSALIYWAFAGAAMIVAGMSNPKPSSEPADEGATRATVVMLP